MAIEGISYSNYATCNPSFRAKNPAITDTNALKQDTVEIKPQNKKKYNICKIIAGIAALGFATFAFVKYTKGKMWEKIKFMLSPIIYIP